MKTEDVSTMTSRVMNDDIVQSKPSKNRHPLNDVKWKYTNYKNHICRGHCSFVFNSLLDVKKRKKKTSDRITTFTILEKRP